MLTTLHTNDPELHNYVEGLKITDPSNDIAVEVNVYLYVASGLTSSNGDLGQTVYRSSGKGLYDGKMIDVPKAAATVDNNMVEGINTTDRNGPSFNVVIWDNPTLETSKPDETLANEIGDIMWEMEYNEPDNPNYTYLQKNSTKYSQGVENIYKSVKNGTIKSGNNYPANYDYKRGVVTPKEPQNSSNGNNEGGDDE
jgi:hypothetical protein